MRLLPVRCWRSTSCERAKQAAPAWMQATVPGTRLRAMLRRLPPVLWMAYRKAGSATQTMETTCAQAAPSRPNRRAPIHVIPISATTQMMLAVRTPRELLRAYRKPVKVSNMTRMAP